MSRQFNIKNWLDEFFARRDLEKPDGRHIFSYHATPDEFYSLENGLMQNMDIDSKICKNQFIIWSNDRLYRAIFVLYSALCWQQRFDGGKWTYEIFLDPLNIRLNNPSLGLQDIIREGFGWWGQPLNATGLRYLGAIAREAGLPQKLLSENRGAVGRILHSVLHEALLAGQSGSIITDWIKSYRHLLPQSYWNNEIISLLADSINAILDIKKNLRANTLKDAMAELEVNDPDWRSRFPLPLYDDAARYLLNSLLEDVATAKQVKYTGSPICARRYLVQTIDNRWSLHSRLDMPSKIKTGLDHNPRILTLSISAGQKTFETVIKKHAVDNFYFFQQEKNIIFSETDAMQEILLQYTTPTGFCQSFACPGGMELDADLPWIFEGKKYDYVFRQQGGGCVRGDVLYVAVTPEWEVKDAENVGPLLETNRHVYRILKCSYLKNGDFVFQIGIANKNDYSYDWGRDNRFWGVEMLQPSLAFRGMPTAITSVNGIKTTQNGEMLWKTPSMEAYSPFSASLKPSGVAHVWFKSDDGASLRSRMLLLPGNASINLSTDAEGNGLICLEHWQAASASIASQQAGLALECHSKKDSLDLVLKALPGSIPPPTVELFISWPDNPRPARIRVPFPQKGARIFTAAGQEISSGTQLCALLLYGLRLYCFSNGVHQMMLRLTLPDGKSLYYPLEAHDDVTVIRLMEWQDALLEMLAMTSVLDDCVFLDILLDNRKVASWPIVRYGAYLVPEGDKAVLSLPRNGIRPSQSYNMKALLLDNPELGPIPLEEILGEDGAPTGMWNILEHLKKNGPWLIFDDTQGTSLRPMLWSVNDGDDKTPRNRLQAAIAEKDKDSRQHAFSSCIGYMEERLDAPEWETLLSLFNHVKYLPLSTLEIWEVLLSSTRIMALVALHPGISFEYITSRVSTELPFLWNFISKDTWNSASLCVKQYFEKRISGDMGTRLWENHIEKCMENLGSYCPSINALLHVAINLPCDRKEMERISSAFQTKVTNDILFLGNNSDMQNLLRRHADDVWPTYFTDLVNSERHSAKIKPFLPFSQGSRNGVLGLPLLLTLQAFVSQTIFFTLPPDRNIIFHIREHMNFDANWFEQASTLTAYHCTAVGPTL